MMSGSNDTTPTSTRTNKRRRRRSNNYLFLLSFRLFLQRCYWVLRNRWMMIQTNNKKCCSSSILVQIVTVLLLICIVIILTIVFVFILLLSVGFLFNHLLPPPELYYTESFVPSDAIDYPSQCNANDIAKKFFTCQERINLQQIQQQQPIQQEQKYTTTTKKRIVRVFVCHRLWCNTIFGGYCEPCMGIGDRMQYMLSQIYDIQANKNKNKKNECIPIQLDYPISDVAILQSAIYVDPSKWYGYMFRYRTYNVQKKNNPMQYMNTKQIGDVQFNYYYFMDRSNQRQKQQPIMIQYDVSHFAPKNQVVHQNYDPCYFYFLFQPTKSLQNDINFHTNTMINMIMINNRRNNNNNNRSTIENQNSDDNKNDKKNNETVSVKRTKIKIIKEIKTTAPTLIKPIVIGIHFRTGDVVAFDIHDHNDTRIRIKNNNNKNNNTSTTTTNSIDTAFEQMLYCADQLTNRLFPSNNDTNNNKQQQQQQQPNVIYFLATDNMYIKQLVQQNQYMYKNRIIYTTNIIPQSSYGGVLGDRNAWMELYLLSKCNGLVVNVVNRKYYYGTAGKISYFAQLAKQIGFMNDTQFYQCTI